MPSSVFPTKYRRLWHLLIKIGLDLQKIIQKAAHKNTHPINKLLSSTAPMIYHRGSNEIPYAVAATACSITILHWKTSATDPTRQCRLWLQWNAVDHGSSESRSYNASNYTIVCGANKIRTAKANQRNNVLGSNESRLSEAPTRHNRPPNNVSQWSYEMTSAVAQTPNNSNTLTQPRSPMKISATAPMNYYWQRLQ